MPIYAHLLSAMAFCEIAFLRMLPESPRIIDRSITFAKSAANLAVYPFLALPSAADKKCLVEDVCDVVFEARVGSVALVDSLNVSPFPALKLCALPSGVAAARVRTLTRWYGLREAKV